jgi:hypothetical protein
MSVHPLSVVSWLVGLASVALLGYAGYTSWDSSRIPAVHVENADLVVNTAMVGDNTIEYVVVNDGSEPIQLLGGDARCFAGCCFGPMLQELPSIPPGGRVTVPYELSVKKAGEPFSAESTLFLHWRGRVVPMKVSVSGTATPSSAAK